MPGVREAYQPLQASKRKAAAKIQIVKNVILMALVKKLQKNKNSNKLPNMKQLFIKLCAILLFSACNNSNPKSETETIVAEMPVDLAWQNRLEVYCFHGTRQCETCKNMKANTKKALDKYFSMQLKDSSIVYVTDLCCTVLYATPSCAV